MTWRIVHVKESEFMKLKLDNLEISKRGQKYYVPLSDISILIVEGNTSVTTNLLSAFTKNNIALVICDEKYLPQDYCLIMAITIVRQSGHCSRRFGINSVKKRFGKKSLVRK